MAVVNANLVKELREKTGVGMMECKAALTEAEGHEDKAIEILRKRGLATATKKSGRIAAENGLGAAEEVHLVGDRAQVFIRKVAPEYFLVIVTGPGTVPGKCRFLLRQAARRTRELL